MADELDVLLDKVDDHSLRAQLRAEIDKVRAKRTFGLVFESHLPERVLLPEHQVRRGAKVVTVAMSPSSESGVEHGDGIVVVVSEDLRHPASSARHRRRPHGGHCRPRRELRQVQLNLHLRQELQDWALKVVASRRGLS